MDLPDNEQAKRNEPRQPPPSATQLWRTDGHERHGQHEQNSMLVRENGKAEGQRGGHRLTSLHCDSRAHKAHHEENLTKVVGQRNDGRGKGGDRKPPESSTSMKP